MRSAAIDVGHLPHLVSGSRAPAWWGMVMLLVIEGTVFGTLIASYFYLRIGQPQWPPPGIAPPDLLLSTLNTGVLLISSGAMYLADSAAQVGNQRRMRMGVVGATVLAVLFLVLKVVEYADVPYGWDTHAYGSIVWTIVGFHSAHVVSLVLKTLFIGVLIWRGYFDEQRNLGVQVNGLYWHFVVVVWIPLYVVLYWSPRLME